MKSSIIISTFFIGSIIPIEEVAPPILVSDTTSYPIRHDSVPFTWDDFVAAVIMVESSGNDSAYNKREKAVGCLQIRPIMVREVNRQLRRAKVDLRYTNEDRWSRDKSIEMFVIIAEGVESDGDIMKFCEVVARKWNGGGRGDKKKATEKYWNKVKQQL